MKRLIQAVMVILLGVLLGMAHGQTVSSDAGSEVKQQEPVTLTWFVAEEGYAKVWNPQENVADAKFPGNPGIVGFGRPDCHRFPSGSDYR